MNVKNETIEENETIRMVIEKMKKAIMTAIKN